jgi:tRNA modification GTPase
MWITGEEPALGAAAESLGMAPIEVGSLRLRNLLGIDRGIVARWSPGAIALMPHGGPAVIRALAAALEDCGIVRAGLPDPIATYPEAADEIEARMLAVLAVAASPLAIDLLLDQPRRWREHGQVQSGLPMPPERRRALDRLIHPPLVVAVGPPNVGKSSLVNALAGRSVSIVADEPGTTRDHVGVMINLGGLVVRYVDTPGLGRRGNAIEREAESLALGVVGGADLILSCADRSSPPARARAIDERPVLTVATRCDLGAPDWNRDVDVSALTGRGLSALVGLVRDTLVPPTVLRDPRPWRFWSSVEPIDRHTQFDRDRR